MEGQKTQVSISDGTAQIVRLLRHRRGWIAGCTVVVPLMVIVGLFRLPDRYTSESTIAVVQQQVSAKYVDPGAVIGNAELVQRITREILSGPRLLSVIGGFGLYRGGRALMPDQLVERMRGDIEVRPVDQTTPRNDYTAFTVSYTHENPRLAQDVTSRLTSLFIEENLKSQGAQASTTTRFLTEQLDAARQRLADQEQKLQAFKQSNLGSLPEQEQANISQLTDLRMQFQTVANNVNRIQQQRVGIESTVNAIIARLNADRTALLGRYTPKHPEVQRKDAAIIGATKLLDHLKAGTVPPDSVLDGASGEDPALAPLPGQIAALSTDAASANREEARLRSQMNDIQARIRLAPVKQQQLSEILRDYELYKNDYQDLSNKQLKSQLTANLAEHQDTQQFRLVDPPTLPSVPSAPKRMKIALGSLGGGLALGLALAFLLEMLKPTFHSEKQVKARFDAPLIVGIPLMRSPLERKRRRRRIALEWVAGVLMLAVVAAAEFYVYLRS